MLVNVTRKRTLAIFDVRTSHSQARKSSSNFPLKYDVPYSPIVETIRKRIAFTHGLKSGVLSNPQVDIFNSTLMRIRQAVKDRNARAVVDHWQHLKQNNLLHHLGATQIEKISELLAANFMPGHGTLRGWDEATQGMMDSIASRAASFCCVDSLAMLMLLYIKRNEPNTVIRLYERFTESLGEKDAWEDTLGDAVKKVDRSMSELHSDSNLHPFHSGRVSLLLAVTAAYAMKDSFQAALDTCNATDTRFNAVSVTTFLEKLDHDPDLQKKMQVWLPKLSIAAQISRPLLLSRRISALAEKGSLRRIEKLYRAVVDGITGPDAFIAAQPSNLTPTKKVTMNDILWSSFLVGFMKCQRRDLAAKLWDDMASFGIQHDVTLWTALISAYDSIHAVDDALASWHMMRAKNVKPDAMSCRAVISALFNGRKPDMAMRIFREYQGEDRDDSLKDQLVVYNTVLHGLLHAHQVQEAKNLLRSMQQAGITPDRVSYNTFLAYYGRRGNFNELADVVNEMANANLTGDVFFFSMILSALLKAGREDAPDIIFKLMQKQGIEPNVATYSAIIDHQMRSDDEKDVRGALLMLRKMEHNPQIHPNEVTYTSILTGLYRNQQLPHEKIQELAKEIVQKMQKQGVQLGLPGYHTLIRANLLNSLPDGLQNAMGYYKEMRERRMPMSHTTWYILLAGLLHREEWEVADKVVSDMFKSGKQPAGSVLELVSKIRRRLPRK